MPASPATAPALTLAALPTGSEALLVRVRVPGSLGDRLVELGLTAGAPVRVVRRAPLGGPLQVQVRDFLLSLRPTEARAIDVALCSSTPVGAC